MNLVKTAVMLVVVAGLLTVAAYTQVIPVTNARADAPVQFNGSVRFGSPDTAAGCNIYVENKTGKQLVEYSFVVDGVAPNGGTFQQGFGHDHFFADDNDLMMDETETNVDCAGWGGTPSNDQNKEPASIKITLTMAQYSDGSTWGDKATIEEVQFQRKVTIAYLKGLAESDNLAKALAVEPPLTRDPTNKHDRRFLTERDITWEIVRRKQGELAQRKEIARRLAIANDRASWLK